jgi:hypothetical protein
MIKQIYFSEFCLNFDFFGKINPFGLEKNFCNFASRTASLTLFAPLTNH